MGPTTAKLASTANGIRWPKLIAAHIQRAVVGCDRIRIEFKFQQSTRTTPRVQLILARNEVPRLADRSLRRK
jgi:hypothetical protein